MIAYMAFSQKFTMEENARFSAGFFTEVKAPANAAHAAPVKTSDLRLRSHLFDTIQVLRIGPNMPTTDEIVQSRYVV